MKQSKTEELDMNLLKHQEDYYKQVRYLYGHKV